MILKSDRLKKLESELSDLEQWLKLGLVPKSETKKHKEEIRLIKSKIGDEIERLKFMKESGDIEEYVAPKKSQGRQAYQEPQTLPEMDIESTEFEEEPFETDQEAADVTRVEEVTLFEEGEEDPFSDRNRWKRGILEDPDADAW